MTVAAIGLGTKVTDTVSGFEGLVTARLEEMHGTTKVRVEGRVNEEGEIPSQWFEEPRLQAND